MAYNFDPDQIAVDKEQIQKIFNGVIDISFDLGIPQYKIGGKVFSDLKSAVEFKNLAGLSVVETFSPGKTLGEYSITPAGQAAGNQLHSAMMNYADKTGYRIHLHHLKNENINPDNIDEILSHMKDEETGQLLGFLSPGKSTTFEQWEDIRTGRFLTAEEIVAEHTKHGTVEKIFGDKIGSAFKRHKSDTRTAELSTTFNRRLRVGVYDPGEFLRSSGLSGLDDITDQMAQMSQDGISLMSPAIISKIRSSKIAERNALVAERKNVAQGTKKHAILTSEIKKIQSKIDELKGISVNGGLYNIRADIFDVSASSHFSGETLDRINRLSGQLKGNVLVVPARGVKVGDKHVPMWTAALKKRGFDGKDVDILTTAASIAENKGEAVLGSVHESQLLLDARKIIKDNWLDTQHYTAHPYLFDVARMKRHTLDVFERQASELVSTGQLPQGMINAFRTTVEKGDSIVGKSGASYQQAKAILNFVDSGKSIVDNPRMLDMALRSMADFFTDGKSFGKDRARLLIPNVVRHEVADFASIVDTLIGTAHMPAATDLQQGYVTLTKTGGFALHNKDVAKFHEAFGGFDLDDLLVSHVRYDETSDEFMLAMTRSPTTHGEIASFKFNEFDDLAEQVLIRHDPEYNFLSQIRNIDKAVENFDIAEVEQLAAHDHLMSAPGNLPSKELRRRQRRLERANKRFRASENRVYELMGSDRDSGVSVYELLDDVDTRVELLKARHSIVLRDLVEKVEPGWKDSIDSMSRAKKYMPDLYELVTKQDGSIVSKPLSLRAEEEAAEFVLKNDESWRTLTGDDMTAAFKATIDSSYELEKYSNTKMILDSMLDDNADEMQDIVDILGSGERGKGFFAIPELEAVIDAQVKDAATDVADDIRYSTALQVKLGEAAAILDARGGPKLKLDKALFAEKTGSESRSIIRKSYNDTMTAMGAEGDFNTHLFEGGYSRLVESKKAVKESIDALVKRMVASSSYDDFYSKHIFAQSAHDDAEFLTKIYGESRERYKDIAPSLDDIADSIDKYGANLLPEGEELLALRRSLVAEDVFSAVRSIGERSGQDGIFRALGALQQVHNDAPQSTKARLARGVLGVRTDTNSMLEMLNGADAFFGVTEGDVPLINIPGLPKPPSHVLEAEAAFYGEKRLASSTISYTGSKKLLDFRDGIKKIASEVPGIKKLAVAGLAVVAGSFLYQHRKDHTQEDVSGPPLLPGGSAYESMPIEANGYYYNRYQQPESYTYNVYASGDFDHTKFSNEASALVGGATNTNVYQSRNINRKGKMDAYIERQFG